MTRIHDSPSVSVTKRKWYIAVAANCSRDTLTRSRSGSMRCSFPGRSALRRVDSLCHSLGADVLACRTIEPAAPDDIKRDALHHEHDRDLARIPGTEATRLHVSESPRPRHGGGGGSRGTSSSASFTLC